MKLHHIIALAICIYTPTMQSALDNYDKGLLLGTLTTASFALVINGVRDLCNARDINDQATKVSKRNASTTVLYNAADYHFYYGINSIALGTTLGIVTGIAYYTKALTPSDSITN